ncbi:2-oxo-4-hydroxy-4-carboxy-5-ureidoimidazoline decarboxylase [Microbacterium paludicola]|uniref:2-oxo-4-hydroxy-4-carboxy-5-ureidoimidazoline decarboxylase n=1 Tax=Microbacterium paludicola TaxID=300019 RepID=A0A4Y9FVI3_9MICO|nr:2-oxo-4-hydroxy-4-carboxy-5-ureidoimidazoline decarboxylase [Microbacterium paludicola]MBF0816027.1 2-oxo-4-hydroxy-4-carboxy-5-ureidoimidazoline decarboxylase [Microbacterium paludicola]TFU33346.1 2-oxo-4-hydroxy-4-carboxy-5-ureidoimidazoline decarboxylase [Microbacterium paludicola]
MLLDDFHALPTHEAASVVRVWADVPGWVATLVAERPYASVDALAARAQQLAAGWTTDDLDAALAHHPRIGERPTAAGAEGDHSRREQASMAHADEAIAARIAAGNAEYERRFGRVFLIRAAGRTPSEMLAELERRLANAPEAEAREAARQLAEIALLRLRAAFDPGDA